MGLARQGWIKLGELSLDGRAAARTRSRHGEGKLRMSQEFHPLRRRMVLFAKKTGAAFAAPV